jgi:hypothetical protein
VVSLTQNESSWVCCFFTLWTYQLVSKQWRSIEKLEAGIQTVMEGVQPIETGSWNTEARIMRMEETLREIRGFLWRLKINLWEDQRRQPLCTRGACHHTYQVIGMITNITIPQLAMQPTVWLNWVVQYFEYQGKEDEQKVALSIIPPRRGGQPMVAVVVKGLSWGESNMWKRAVFLMAFSIQALLFSTSYKYCIEKRTCKAPKYIGNVTLK